MICGDDRDSLQLFEQALKSIYNVILVASGEDCTNKVINDKKQGLTKYIYASWLASIYTIMMHLISTYA